MNNEQRNTEELAQLRHSAAHLLAAAVLELYPTAKPTIGPATDDGFYYDFDFGSAHIGEADLQQIEKKMRFLVKNWGSFERTEVSKEQALATFLYNEYKTELIEEFSQQDSILTFYKSGNFTDLCKGGHIEKPATHLKHFKLLSIAGAYWRGSEENKMLTRIYGTAFFSAEELQAYLTQKEEARKRDHRKLGRELDLFTFSPLIGSGLPLYTPKGAFIRRTLNDYIEYLQSQEGYQQVWTPQIAKAELFKTSGHYDKYKEDMFRVVSNYSTEEMFLKPMNCPQHTQIYASQPRSYKDLPIRLTDFAMLYRDERPGELNGLARVRSFSQDDCHIFCTPEQVDAEIDKALQMTKKVMQVFGFTYRYRLSTRDPQTPEKYIGDPKIWDKVEAWAVDIMKRNDIEYYDGPGEAAFYAPKMDLMATDALGREWQLSTVQIDFAMPERFNLTYTDSDGTEKRPVMLHRAILGSSERMMMILIEHFAGKFPVWLAPVQVKILPVSDKYNEYAHTVAQQLHSAGLRAELDERSERLQAKIRNAQMEKIPYMLVVGEQEENAQTVAVRNRDDNKQSVMSIAEFVQHIMQKVVDKSL